MSNEVRCLLIILFSVYIAGCSSPFPAPVSGLERDYDSVSRGSYRGSYYKVREGDTLYFISYVTDKDVNEIIRYNHLSPPYTIYPGQELLLWRPVYTPPVRGKKSSNSSQVSHSVISSAATVAAVAKASSPSPANIIPKIRIKKKVVPKKSSIVTKHVVKKPVKTTSASSQSKTKLVTKSKGGTPVKKNGNKVTNVSLKNSKYAQNANKIRNKHTKVSKKPAKSVERSQAKRYGEPEGKKNVNKSIIKSKSGYTKIRKWIWPTKGRVIRRFSIGDQGNKGIDIAGRRGQPVVSSAPGTVVYSGNALRGYGNLVIIKHNDKYLSAYAHNDRLLVREGQNVKAGQKIATMGSSGTNKVRLHFEIRYQGKPVNPKRYLP
ncbi:peptidoglycan DD-metalloendopeptidase family protein [Vibrio quintilis]|uniref:Murein hydrolase activator NlpD n=1 Tax=Vibrio quintilis TaxID=1117707 RepID=A0A1M7YRW3_9VIBR|nr:peptidoglycan DD-metalloendopeptidase family protein [Vibrio quintilis]SHO55374.1 Murein hydrolase activator NlpD precursor [Vibrio quintilis]